MLKPRLTRVADEKEDVYKSDEADLPGPAFIVDEDVPGMDVTIAVTCQCIYLLRLFVY